MAVKSIKQSFSPNQDLHKISKDIVSRAVQSKSIIVFEAVKRNVDDPLILGVDGSKFAVGNNSRQVNITII